MIYTWAIHRWWISTFQIWCFFFSQSSLSFCFIFDNSSFAQYDSSRFLCRKVKIRNEMFPGNRKPEMIFSCVSFRLKVKSTFLEMSVNLMVNLWQKLPRKFHFGLYSLNWDAVVNVDVWVTMERFSFLLFNKWNIILFAFFLNWI